MPRRGELRTALDAHPSFERFPVAADPAQGQDPDRGWCCASDAQRALDADQPPPVRAVPTCVCASKPSARRRRALIESRDGMVLILDKPEDGVVVGLLTLHDLLRAQDRAAGGSP